MLKTVTVKKETTDIGVRLYETMDAAGLSVMDVSKKSGLNRIAIYTALGPKGERVRADVIEKLCSALAITPNWLLTGNEQGIYER